MANFIGATPSEVSAQFSKSRLVAAATTNAAVIKANPGNVYGWYYENNAAYAVFVKLYDKATAPTVGADIPALTILVPAGGIAQFSGNIGIPFANGIAIAATKLFADTDTTVLVANDVQGNLLFK